MFSQSRDYLCMSVLSCSCVSFVIEHKCCLNNHHTLISLIDTRKGN